MSVDDVKNVLKVSVTLLISCWLCFRGLCWSGVSSRGRKGDHGRCRRHRGSGSGGAFGRCGACDRRGVGGGSALSALCLGSCLRGEPPPSLEPPKGPQPHFYSFTLCFWWAGLRLLPSSVCICVCVCVPALHRAHVFKESPPTGHRGAEEAQRFSPKREPQPEGAARRGPER